MTAPIDTLGTDQPICPWCGHEHGPWDWDLNDTEGVESRCDSCGESFVTTRNVTVTYDTRKP